MKHEKENKSGFKSGFKSVYLKKSVFQVRFQAGLPEKVFLFRSGFRFRF